MSTDEFLRRLADPAGGIMPPAAVVVAHPDDEVVGMGSRLPRLLDGFLVHVTDGSPEDLFDAHNNGCETREEYADLRRCERAAMLAKAGLSPKHVREMGCRDQHVPRNMVGLARAAAGLLRDFGVGFVLTHPYEGGHPDHDATAFVVHAACRLMERDGLAPPALLEMTSYFNRGGAITPYEFLPDTGEEPVTATLTGDECDLKRDLLACYPSQQGTLQYFPVGVERFRPAPGYDFTRPPHEGTLFYECFNWGMRGPEFRDLAREALWELELEGEM